LEIDSPAIRGDDIPKPRGGVDVAIVAYRCRDLLRQCLASLLSQPPGRPMSVFVVDNASGDGTPEMVAAEFPGVRVTASERNLGFAAATNRAIESGDGDWVLALNPDTRVPPGAIDRLLAVVAERPEIGICGCDLRLEDGTPDHAAKRSFPTPLTALGHFTGLGRRAGGPKPLVGYGHASLEPGQVDAVNGAFMLIRRAALAEVGLFDEGFWMYMEDLDLCYRFRSAGWITWYEPSVTVTHVKAGTSGPARSPRLDYAFHYGMYRFYRKHYAGERSPLVNAAIYAGIAVKLASSIVANALRRARLALSRGPQAQAAP
jgi:GT2 family glycosyltransferase